MDCDTTHSIRSEINEPKHSTTHANRIADNNLRPLFARQLRITRFDVSGMWFAYYEASDVAASTAKSTGHKASRDGINDGSCSVSTTSTTVS